MATHKQTQKQFSLKDQLFNKKKVQKLASEIRNSCPEFDKSGFCRSVLRQFPKQELMQRLTGIRDQLHAYLPQDYEKAVVVIHQALPPELDPQKTDNDFGDFIYAPYAYFVAEFGCEKRHLKISLNALKEITKRFSVEGAIRNFLNDFPTETLKEMEKWSRDKNYHVRRAATEGTRPFLPWAKKILTKPTDVVPILEQLHLDKTRYVTRSVANHMNDLSKIDPGFVVRLLQQWQKSGGQDPKEMQFIVNHSLRTLVKQGDAGAMKLLGYDSSSIKVKNFEVHTPRVKVGNSLEFSFDVVSTVNKTQDVLFDYIVHFRKANGALAPKTHKIGKRTLGANETTSISKGHPLRLMSTRTLYSGEQAVELQINGKRFGKKRFDIV